MLIVTSDPNSGIPVILLYFAKSHDPNVRL